MNKVSEAREARLKQLDAATTKRSARTDEAIRGAVQVLNRAHLPINFSNIAKQAGVTRQTVYNSSFRKEIENLREKTSAPRPRSEIRSQTSEASLKKRLDVAFGEIERLKIENHKLRKSLSDVLLQVRTQAK